MDALARVLQESRLDVLRVALTGHRGDREALTRITREQWLGEMMGAHEQTAQRARELGNVPCSFVGYSLGGLLVEDLMNELKRSDLYERIVLFAPGIALRSILYFRRVASFFRSLPIPSLTPKVYRANNSLPAAVYGALFDSYEHLHQSHFRSSNVPTLVMTDPKDEFVSYRGIERAVQEHHLDQWTLLRIDRTRKELRRKYHHMITDPEVLGEEWWSVVTRRMREHLGVG